MLLAGTARVTQPPPEVQAVDLHVAEAAPGGDPHRPECLLTLSAPGRPMFGRGRARFDLMALGVTTDLEQYGRALGATVFAADALGPAFEACRSQASGRRDLLRLRLLVDEPALQAVAWERLRLPIDGVWLAVGVGASTPFSRYAPHGTWESAPPPTARPLRLLAIVASPPLLNEHGLDPIPQAERERLHATLSALPDVELVWLESGTSAPAALAGIQQALARDVHLVHVLCHGALDHDGTVLFLDDGRDGTAKVGTRDVVETIRAARTPPAFVFFAACETAAHTASGGFRPLAPRLLEMTGVPAVLAMTEPVGLDTAQTFTAEFYARLFRHGIVDVAVNEARALVRQSLDFGAPVLYSRLADNQLLDFPLAEGTAAYLRSSATALRATADVIRQVRQEGGALVGELFGLIDELTKSHRVIVDWATRFRATDDPEAGFAQAFRRFATDLQQYYLGQTWNDERTHCSRVFGLAGTVEPLFAQVLTPELYAAVERELRSLGDADGMAIAQFDDLLGRMHGAATSVVDRLNAGDTAGALDVKRQFDFAIGPTLLRSRQLLQQMHAAAGRVEQA